MSSRAAYAANDDRLAVRGRALVIGVVIFLASELMFFSAWFAAYLDLRGRSAAWPPAGVGHDVLEPSIGTALLALSSLLVVVAMRDIHRDLPGRARAWLLGTIACALAFLTLTVHGWLKNDYGPATHAYGSVYYGITGFHALHVTAGVLALAYLAAGASRPAFRGAHAAGAEAIGYYWHFVFVVWLGIYLMVDILR